MKPYKVIVMLLEDEITDVTPRRDQEFVNMDNLAGGEPASEENDNGRA